MIDAGREFGAGSSYQPGDRLGGGRFTLVEVLGQGGMGTVWLANDEQLSADGIPVQVALKFISFGGPTDAELVRLLRKEVRASLRLSHTNILRVHSWHEHPGEPVFYSMEYLPGLDLQRLLRNQPHGRFTGKQLEPLLNQLLAALQYAHQEAGIVHRDIKPANVLVTPGGQLKLTDFGLARDNATGDVLATTRGGTLLYASPQQRAGAAPTVTDDIYSLGAMLYHLLTGQPPHSGDALSSGETLPAPVHPWQLLRPKDRRQISAEAAATLLRSLSPEAEQRPQDIETFSRWWRSGPPIEKTPRPPRELGWSVGRYVPGGLWLGAIIWIALILFVWMIKQSDTVAKWSPLLGQWIVTSGEWVGDPPESDVWVPPPPPPPPPSETNRFDIPSTNELTLSNLQQGHLVLRLVSPSAENVQVEIFDNATFGAVAADEAVRKLQLSRHEPLQVSNLKQGTYIIEAGIGPRGPRLDPTRWVRQVAEVASNQTKEIELDLRPSEPHIYLNQQVPFSLLDPWGQYVDLTDMEFNQRPTPPDPRAPFEAKFPLKNRKSLLPGRYSLRFEKAVTDKARVEPWADELFELVGGSFTNTILLTPWKIPRLYAPWKGPHGIQLLPVASSGNFLGGETEVTVGQFEAFAQATRFPTHSIESVTATGWTNLGRTWRTAFPGVGTNHPVVGVSWHDATNFCGWLTATEQQLGKLGPGQRYALPSAEQWTQMAGTNTYPWGTNYPPKSSQGNYAGRELEQSNWPTSWVDLLLDYNDQRSIDTVPVGTNPPNGKGFRDLGGNAAEWCTDWYHSDMNDQSLWRAPSARLKDDGGGNRYRVVRGGSWFDHDDQDLLKTKTLWAETPDTRNDRIGFRVVLIESP